MQRRGMALPVAGACLLLSCSAILGLPDLPDVGDASVDGGGAHGDAARDGAAADAGPQMPIGAVCVANGDCASRFCAAASVLGTETSVCTAMCCASDDCPDGSVCHASAAGSYCVDPLSVGRSVPDGTKPGGALEDASASNCRSGVLANGRCADTCCRDGDCEDGTACMLGTMDSHSATICAPLVSDAGPGTACTKASHCHDGICAQLTANTTECVARCCSTAECGLIEGVPAACIYVKAGADNIPMCATYQVGTGGAGAACQDDGGCATDECLTDPKTQEQYCTDRCCSDWDCVAGFVCRPTPLIPKCVRP